MRPIGRAIAYQLWCRHGRGIATIVGLVVFMALSFPALRDFAKVVWPGKSDEVLVTFAWLLMGSILAYATSLFLMADAHGGSIGAGYSRRMFTLPARTAELVAWPFLFGIATLAGLWVLMTTLVLWPCGSHVPLLLPAFGLATYLAWLLALSWTPFRFPWLGVVISALVIVGQFMAMLCLAEIVHFSRAGLIAILIGSIALAYGIAVLGVSRDRRGDGRIAPSWWFRFVSKLTRPHLRRGPFPSAARAQLAYEWWNNGLTLPFIMVLMLAIVLGGFVFGHKMQPASFLTILAIFTIVPVVMAGPTGVNLSQWKPVLDSKPSCQTFVMTRPATSGVLVAAKFRAAALSILTAYLLGLPLLILGAWLSGYAQDLARLGDEFFGRYPGGKGLAVLVLGGFAVLVLAWKQMTDGLAGGLSGQRWRVELGAVGFLVFLFVVIGGGTWIGLHPEHWATVIKAFPWLVGLGAVVKALAALWAYPRALRLGVLTAGEVRRILIVWLVVVAGMEALILLLRPDAGFGLPAAIVLVGVASAVPLVRLASAPLALNRNRHR